MAEIKVTSGELRMKKSELEQLNQQFQNSVLQLEETIQTLSGSWEGESHDAFYQAFEGDKGKMELFANTVRSYAQTLEAIISQYEAAEQRNLSIAQSRTC